MPDRIELGATAKGSMGEDKDWWRLVINDGGKMFVEHEWSHRSKIVTGWVSNSLYRV